MSLDGGRSGHSGGIPPSQRPAHPQDVDGPEPGIPLWPFPARQAGQHHPHPARLDESEKDTVALGEHRQVQPELGFGEGQVATGGNLRPGSERDLGEVRALVRQMVTGEIVHRVRPVVLNHLEQSIQENEELGHLLAK